MLRATCREIPQKIYIVGPIAPPLGGVSSHVLYLVQNLVHVGMSFSVLDPYSGGVVKKALTGVDYRNFPGFLDKFRLIALLVRIVISGNGIIHFHFSRLNGVFVAALATMLVMHNACITLHHGELEEELLKRSWISRRVLAFLMGRFGRIFALSERQLNFYANLLKHHKNLRLWGRMPLRLNVGVFSKPKSVFREKLVVMSGQPTDIYQYEAAIDIVSRLAAELPVRIHIFIYGTPNLGGYVHKLINGARNKGILTISIDQDHAAFLSVLSCANLYIRPTLVDSYGLAVVEALNLGVPVIASDVCIRDSRAILVEAGDHKSLEKKMRDVLSDESRFFPKQQEQASGFDIQAHYRMSGS